MHCVSMILPLVMASVAHLSKPNSIDMSLLNHIPTVFSSNSRSVVNFPYNIRSYI